MRQTVRQVVSGEEKKERVREREGRKEVKERMESLPLHMAQGIINFPAHYK